MSLTVDQVRQVATLARLHLDEQELVQYARQMSDVLDYVQQLAEVDTSNCEPLSHAASRVNPLAADQVLPGLNREAALGNAPKRDDECFLVPAVLG